jgi:hypothetical protein
MKAFPVSLHVCSSHFMSVVLLASLWLVCMLHGATLLAVRPDLAAELGVANRFQGCDQLPRPVKAHPAAVVTSGDSVVAAVVV